MHGTEIDSGGELRSASGAGGAAPFRSGRRALLATVTALAIAACGGGTGDAPTAEEADAPTGEAPSAEATVSMAATAEGELPAAVLGEAPPLAGVDVQYVPGDSRTEGYLAVPDGEGPFPAVILIHEWNGLVDRVRQVADAMAAEGYVALAADLYQGRTGSSGDENRALASEARSNMDAVIANLDAAQSFLHGRSDVSGRIGAMGWCFGGGIALSYGLGGEAHDATAIFYGNLLADPEALAALDHEVYGTFAEMDGGIPPEDVADFEAALDEAGVAHDLHVYDAVNHGFWLRVDGDPGLRSEPALDAWERLKAYLERTLRM